MNLEKAVFGFVLGDIGDATYHNEHKLFAAAVVNPSATVLKFGERALLGVFRPSGGMWRRLAQRTEVRRTAP